MGKGRVHWDRAGRLALSILALTASFSAPAQAFRVPVGGVASQQKLKEAPGAGESKSGQYNVSYVPLLLNIARVMGRFQTHPAFYILNEPFADQPGIDLRSLLFRQSSPLLIPDGLGAPMDGMPARESVGPKLSVPIIGDKAEPPAEARRAHAVPPLSVRSLPSQDGPAPVSEPSARVASPEEIALRVQSRGLDSPPHVLMLDFQGLSAALTGVADPTAQMRKLAFETPRLRAFFVPSPSSSGPTSTASSAFLIWTVRPGTTGGGGAQGSKELPVEAARPGSPYQGSFVACLQGVRFRSIQSREFDLEKGRLLAANRGDRLLFRTTLAEIRMTGRTSAIIDVSERNVLRVISLERDEPSGISVHVTGGQTLLLPKGEEVVVGDHDLKPEEIAGDDGLTRKEMSGSGHVARNLLQLPEVLEKEPLLNPKVSAATDPQRSALSQLRDSVSH